MKPIAYNREAQNESRADYGARIKYCTPDWGSNELATDITDALADVVHFIHRCGLNPNALFDDALRSAQGDLEDGPEAVLDASIAERHDSFDEVDEDEHPDPPEHLADAWSRFQRGEECTPSELRKLDEWRADAREEALGW